MDARKDHSTITTMGGYAVIAVLVGVWYYTSHRRDQRRQSHVIKQPTRPSHKETAGDVKKKAEKAVRPKPNPQPKSSSPQRSEATEPNSNYNKEEVEIADKKADREFARQLSNVHAGTKFNAKKSEDKRQKSVKQSKAKEVASEKTSVPSSTTGDADDDLSSQASPASPVVIAVDSQGVADMLEPVTPGPSVLRLTSTDSVKTPNQRKPKASEPTETKKQRQNRKKAEAAKAAREEEEKERKIKMEQQRRTARIAEGRPAKDGSTLTTAQNAWNAQSSSDNATVELLDTFERDPKPKQQTKPEQQPKPEPTKTVTSSSSLPPSGTKDAWTGLPSEEEQLELLRQEDSWSEVKTKKKGKKKDAAVEDFTPSTQPANSSSAAAGTASSRPTSGAKKPIITSSSSSFAALTPEEVDDDNDMPEEEWDV
ncbi:hypothetical protein F4802DRAFT_230411 [Xylaria palmicola]|nr:hypothetical protein F4802DRAFT_230411 [Xylaria palmicola]